MRNTTQKTLVPRQNEKTVNSNAARNQKGSRTTSNRNARSEQYEEDSNLEFTPYICVRCSQEIQTSDPPLECDFCECEYCLSCSKMITRQAYQQLSKSKEQDGTIWYCHYCRVSFPGVRRMVCRVTKVEELQQDVARWLDELENHGTDDKIDDKIKQAFCDQREVESRKFNTRIICFGITEPSFDDANQKRDEDNRKVWQIFEDVMALDGNSIQLKEKPIKIGKPVEGKCRPLKIIVDSVESKKMILQGAHTKVRFSEEEICQNVNFPVRFDPNSKIRSLHEKR